MSERYLQASCYWITVCVCSDKIGVFPPLPACRLFVGLMWFLFIPAWWWQVGGCGVTSGKWGPNSGLWTNSILPKICRKTLVVCRVVPAPWSSVDLIWRKLWRKCSCVEEWWEAPGSLLGQAEVLTGHYQNIASVSRFSLRLPRVLSAHIKSVAVEIPQSIAVDLEKNLDSQN